MLFIQLGSETVLHGAAGNGPFSESLRHPRQRRQPMAIPRGSGSRGARNALADRLDSVGHGSISLIRRPALTL